MVKNFCLNFWLYRNARGEAMETITYIQVQRLIKKLPETKLSLAYRLLLELVGKEVDMLSPQADFMRLSLDERRRILAQQAEQMKIHYE